MALAGIGVQAIPLMGAAIFLPSAMATALRLHAPSDRRIENDREAVDAILAFMKAEDRMAVEIRKGLSHSGLLEKNLPKVPEDDDYDDDDDTDFRADTVERTLSFDTDGSTDTPHQRPVGSLDTWSVVWYCGMFAAFTSLFLIMPCSQVLCKAGLAAARRDPRLRPRPPLLAPSSGIHYGTPPPPYKQFAPPPYESLFDPQAPSPHLEKMGVYIIPLRDDSERLPPPVDSPPPAYSETVTAAVAAAVAAPAHTGMSPSVA